MERKNNTHENMYDDLIVFVTQKEILSHDLSFILSVFSRLDAELIPAKRNSVKIVVSMPENENRELVEIPEVRAFFRRLFNEVDSLFYWLDPFDNSFWLMPFYVQENSNAFFRIDSQVLLDVSCISEYISRGCENLEVFCERKGVSPKYSRNRILACYKRKNATGQWFV